MIFRKATEADIPSIVSLLKVSLGEGLVPKSVNYWNWKHNENPFGTSEVLLAEENDQLIGVRAFMRWNWQTHNTIYRSLRAVDTVVHPKFQGKGIFKKLTLALREQCKSAGYDFIFNTPNTLSRPGYLKMGWEDLGRIRIRVKFHLPAGLKNVRSHHDLDINEAVLQYTPVPQKIIANKRQTCINTDYLVWRYVHCPVVKYYGYTHPQKGWMLIGYPKKTTKGIELRITEWLPGNEQPTHHEFRKALRFYIQKFNPVFITISSNRIKRIGSLLLSNGFLPALPIGPRLTYCVLADRMSAKIDLSDFSYSVGDMELF